MTRQQFERIVAEEANRIPEQFRARLANLTFVAEEEPTAERLRDERVPPGDTLLGFFEGIPLGGQAGVGWQLPNRITVFRRPTEAEARARRKAVRTVVRETIWHEVAHYLGMDEREVRAAEDRRSARGIAT